MPLYSYSALNEKGTRMHGTIDAASIDEARAAIKKQGLMPEEVFQISYAASGSTVFSEPPGEALSAKEPVEQDVPPPPPSSVTEARTESDWHLNEEKAPPPHGEKKYYPFADTLRLYAGWLLAWYAVVYALGYYQSTRNLPFEIPYLMGIYTSPLVLSFTLASFLFLLATSLHRLVGRGLFAGIFFSILGLAAFVFYRMNV